MLLGGLEKLTLIDYPGKIAATVFTIGCNFSCPFCHNPELVDPLKIKNQPLISEEDFFDFLKQRQEALEGVCITGGEPILQKDLPEFIKKIKNFGFGVKLDTNGSDPEIIENLIKEKLVDYFAMDIKAPLGSNFQFSISNFQLKSKFQIPKYEKTAGVKVDLTKIRKSIEIIKNSGVDYEFRTTVVPVLHSKEDILEIAKELSPAKKYFLQQFRPGKTLDSSLEKEKPYSSEELAEICQTIQPYFDYCGIRE